MTTPAPDQPAHPPDHGDAVLRIVSGLHVGATRPLARREMILVGSGDDCDVVLADASPAHLRLAADYGAGRLDDGGAEPTLIVVAVPPDLTGRVVADELAAHPGSVVTDVASVKVAPLAELSIPAK